MQDFKLPFSSSAKSNSMPSKSLKRREVHQVGDPRFIGEARAILSEIRKIHCVDKNPKVDEFVPDDSGERVAGKNQQILIQEELDRLTVKLAVVSAQKTEG